MTDQEKAEEYAKPSVWPSPLVEDFNDPDWPNLEADDTEVLKWVTANKKLLMRTITWNLCAKPPPSKETFSNTLLIKKFHVFIFGTEECERSIAQSAINPSKKNWEQYLADCFGPMYVPVRSHTLQAIHVMAFVHKAIAPLCTVATSAAVPTGVGNTLGNKGGVGIFLKIGSTRILVVNAHLTAHQNAVRQRNNDFAKINRVLPSLLEKKETSRDLFSPASPNTVTNNNNFSSSSLVPISSTNLNSSNNFNEKQNRIRTISETPEVTDRVNEKPSSSSKEPPKINDEQPPSVVNLKSGIDNADNPLAEKDTQSPPPASENVAATNTAEDHDSDSESEDQSPRYSKSIPNDSANDLIALSQKGIRQCAEVVVFMGDLNYRIKGNRSIIDRLIESNMHEVLLMNDQLRTSMNANEVLLGFTEAPLNFKPTYKYDVGTNIYDSGPKQRIPSWTDRILYVPSADLHCIAYNCDNSIMTSDHKPVYASFMVPVQLFVSLDENQNAVLPTDLSPKFTSESQVCRIM